MKKYGLSATEKIKSRKEFEKVFTEGKVLYSANNVIRVNYKIKYLQKKPGVLFAVTVSKKLGNAVWRNRIKRLIRESYRLNKVCLIKHCKNKNVILEIIFSPQALNQQKNEHVGFLDLESPLKEIIAKLKETI